jgi:hypothetical protein
MDGLTRVSTSISFSSFDLTNEFSGAHQTEEKEVRKRDQKGKEEWKREKKRK